MDRKVFAYNNGHHPIPSLENKFVEFLDLYAFMAIAEDRRRAMRQEVTCAELAAEAVGNQQLHWAQGIVTLLTQASAVIRSVVLPAERASPRTSTAVNQP
jgi:hypothetical protein